MAVEFNGKGNVNNFKIGKDVPKSESVKREEQVIEQEQSVDNKFVKELGRDLLNANIANLYGANFTKQAGEKIDREFWGEALKGLNLKETAINSETTRGIAEIDRNFAIIDMEEKMAKSPFIQALNKEFGID